MQNVLFSYTFWDGLTFRWAETDTLSGRLRVPVLLIEGRWHLIETDDDEAKIRFLKKVLEAYARRPEYVQVEKARQTHGVFLARHHYSKREFVTSTGHWEVVFSPNIDTAYYIGVVNGYIAAAEQRIAERGEPRYRR